jgi:FixJ family two-component response regulator
MTHLAAAYMIEGSTRHALARPMGELAIIHIVDDDESQREALLGLLRSVDIKGCAYSSVADFLATKLPDTPGCLVLDVRLPGIGGLDFQAQLAGHGIRLPVILMTGHGDIPMSVRGMKAGAVDFLTKPFRDQDMLDAVAAAVARDRVRRAADSVAVSLQERYQTLSMREREVMLLVTNGKMNKQIAHEVGLSEITVKIHRGTAMRKMGARTLADLVKMAEALKLGSSRPE